MKKKKPVKMKPWTGEVIVNLRTGEPDMTTLRKKNIMLFHAGDERVASVRLTETPPTATKE